MYCWELWGVIPDGTGHEKCLVSIREGFDPQAAEDGCRSAMNAFNSLGASVLDVRRVWHSEGK